MSLLGRLFTREPADPADAMIAWLGDKNLDDRWLAGALLYGGPYSLKVQKWLLSRPDCDVGTAAHVLWESGLPYGVIKGADFPLFDEVKRDLIAFIGERWRYGLFAPAVFAFDPRDPIKKYRRELAKQGLKGQDPLNIPEQAWTVIEGRKAEGTVATGYRQQPFAELCGAIRLADLAAANPKDWEEIRRKSLGQA